MAKINLPKINKRIRVLTNSQIQKYTQPWQKLNTTILWILLMK